ncbi:hypothetical protein QJS64_11230 [Paraclostridium bifermentans]|uniref:Secreted protein n=1 Tax=Paraclostridium bifermentans TaxID=1490 RepID=A0ABY8R200_PARBF|nr:hypothetical protein QJS64_11230 [Paraclostridium bifermentans]
MKKLRVLIVLIVIFIMFTSTSFARPGGGGHGGDLVVLQEDIVQAEVMQVHIITTQKNHQTQLRMLYFLFL